MVMSRYLVAAIQQEFPGAALGFIVKKGLESCPGVIPAGARVYVFSKKEYPGLRGVYRFGRLLKRDPWDMFFSLPDSFSAAVMAWATATPMRIGYGKEGRNFLLTHAYRKPSGMHRSDIYRNLLYQFLKKEMPAALPLATSVNDAAREGLVVNINSEAISRRWPIEKAVSVLRDVYTAMPMPVTLVGSPADKPHVDAVAALLPPGMPVTNLAGKTSLPELAGVIGKAQWMLSADSGPAHLAALSDTPVLVTFGAGDEHETGPAFFQRHAVVRLGKLPCEPCRSNTCKLAKLPPCLLQLENERIISSGRALLGSS